MTRPFLLISASWDTKILRYSLYAFSERRINELVSFKALDHKVLASEVVFSRSMRLIASWVLTILSENYFSMFWERSRKDEARADWTWLSSERPDFRGSEYWVFGDGR